MEIQNNIESAGRMVVTFDNKAPVELADLTLSLLALSDEYKRFLSRQGDGLLDQDVKLYVNQLKQGSIIVDLLSAAPAIAATGVIAIPYMSQFNTVLRFGEYVQKAYKFLLTRSDPPEHALEKTDLKNLSAFVEPVAKDPGSTVSIQVNGAVNAPILVLTSVQSGAAQNQASRIIEQLGESMSGVHEKVLLYWKQTKNDPKSDTGDRAIIEAFSSTAIKTVFATSELKAAVIQGVPHPYRTGYIVDVNVQTVRGKPMLYTILRLHDTFEIPDHNENGGGLLSLPMG